MGDLVELPKPTDASVADTKAVKVGKHIRRHKKKYSLMTILASVIAIIQMWPMVCPSLMSKDKCPSASIPSK